MARGFLLLYIALLQGHLPDTFPLIVKPSCNPRGSYHKTSRSASSLLALFVPLFGVLLRAGQRVRPARTAVYRGGVADPAPIYRRAGWPVSEASPQQYAKKGKLYSSSSFN